MPSRPAHHLSIWPLLLKTVSLSSKYLHLFIFLGCDLAALASFCLFCINCCAVLYVMMNVHWVFPRSHNCIRSQTINVVIIQMYLNSSLDTHVPTSTYPLSTSLFSYNHFDYKSRCHRISIIKRFFLPLYILHILIRPATNHIWNTVSPITLQQLLYTTFVPSWLPAADFFYFFMILLCPCCS